MPRCLFLLPKGPHTVVADVVEKTNSWKGRSWLMASRWGSIRIPDLCLWSGDAGEGGCTPPHPAGQAQRCELWETLVCETSWPGWKHWTGWHSRLCSIIVGKKREKQRCEALCTWPDKPGNTYMCGGSKRHQLGNSWTERDHARDQTSRLFVLDLPNRMEDNIRLYYTIQGYTSGPNSKSSQLIGLMIFIDRPQKGVRKLRVWEIQGRSILRTVIQVVDSRLALSAGRVKKTENPWNFVCVCITKGLYYNFKS